MFFSSLAWIFSPNYFQKKRERARKRKTYYSAAILWLFTLGEMPAYLNKFQIGDDSQRTGKNVYFLQMYVSLDPWNCYLKS